MAEYIDREKLLDELGESASHHAESGREYQLLLRDRNIVREQPTADVIEREKIDKAIEEIKQTLYVDSLIFGELFDFKDGKISADDVIEEFNRVTRKEVLDILKRNIGESKEIK